MKFFHSLLTIIILLFFSSPLYSKDRYIVKVWTIEDGLPQNSVNSIVEDSSGYLWIATFGGIVRFDGVRFTIVTELEKQIRTKRILSLCYSSSDILWIGTEGEGLSSYVNGKLKTFNTDNGLSDNVVLNVFEDSRKRIWCGTRRGINRFDNDTIIQIPLPSSDSMPWIYSIKEDSAHRLWVNTAVGVFYEDADGNFRQFSSNPSSLFLCSDNSNTLWFRLDRSIVGSTFSEGRENAWEKSFLIKRMYKEIVQDTSGVYWLWAEQGGLFYAKSDLVTSPFNQISLPDNEKTFRIRSVFFDKEGNRWFGTDGNGLIRITDPLFRIVSKEDGLSNDIIEPVLEDSKGNIWIGTNCGGVNIITKEGGIKTLPELNEIAAGCIWSLAEDARQRIWIGTYGQGIYIYSEQGIQKINSRSGLRNDVVVVLMQSKDKASMWIGTDGGGLHKYENGFFYYFTEENGLVNNSVRTVFEDVDGSLWIGTLGGLSHLKGGTFKNYTLSDGLTSNYIRCVFRDSKGNLWIGTYGGGLLRYKDSEFQNISINDGLFDNIVSAIAEDNYGNLWMTCNRGIYRVRIRDLIDFCEGKQKRVYSYVYGTEDGLLSSETNGGFQPSIWKTRNGDILIPTIKGLAILNPTLFMQKKVTVSNIFIEKVLVNRYHYTGTTLELENDVQSIEVFFTAINRRHPHHIFFEYKLDGFSDEWISIANQRSILLTTLPPKKYRLYIRGFSESTDTYVKSDTLSIIIKPPFWQRGEFFAILAFFVLVVATVMVSRRKRLQQQKEEEKRAYSLRFLDSVEHERKKIAEDLHDSIGQDLLIIKNRAILGLQEKKKAGMVQQLEEISDTVSKAIEHIRELSYELRPYQIDRLGIVKSLESLVSKSFRNTGIKIKANIKIDDAKIPKEYGIHLYRILQEALKNVVKHSNAKDCEVKIFYNEEKQKILISIHDNGIGFDYNEFQTTDAKLRGLGLSHIQERVQLLGGTFSIKSELHNGTSITIEIPL